MPMTLDLAFPVLPPTLDGIGDYTAQLSQALAARADVEAVRILTAQPDHEAPPGVEVEVAFGLHPTRAVRPLAEAVAARRPDWFVLQYNPFSYGPRGFNPHLPRTVRRLRQLSPSTRIAVMVHEPFVPRAHWRFMLMWTWQRAFFRQLGAAADVLFFSIEPWAEIFAPWFPKAQVVHLPVGSNILRVDADRQAQRQALGYTEEELVVGVFGGAHPSRLLPLIRAGVHALQQAHRVRVLYIGNAGAAIRTVLDGVPVHDAGKLASADVSRHFAAMDMYLAPFRHGVSTRRGSFLVGLQHGIPSVSTYGRHTGRELRTLDGEAFLLTSQEEAAYATEVLRLAGDAALRNRLRTGSRAAFDAHFAWEHVAGRLVQTLLDSSYPARMTEAL